MKRVLFLMSLACVAGACSDAAGITSHEAPADVIYESGGTHEVWERVDEAAILGTAAMGPQLSMPVGPIPRGDTPPVFVWTESEASRVRARAPQRSRMSTLVSDLFHPVAHAHNPVTGDMYRLVFSIPGVDPPVRVVTGSTTYTPGAEAWARMQDATGPITLELVYAYLDTGLITDGPYRGPLATLELQ